MLSTGAILPVEAPRTATARAHIVTIGSEILLGEIIDTNAPKIARALRAAGLEVIRTTSIGDDVKSIARAVRQAAQTADAVITTGGLGPTVDDPTRAALAEAAGVALRYHPELWEQVRAMFLRFDREPTENNKRQAWLPEGAVAITNPVGTAPAFALMLSGALVVALPGVPREMEHLLAQEAIPRLRDHLGLTDAFAIRVLRTTGAGESQIDEAIGDLEEAENPRVGLAAHAGSVDVRITARARDVGAAHALIVPIEAELRRRLGAWIYGVDEETLAGATMASIANRGWQVVLVEAGLGGKAVQALSEGGDVFAGANTWTAALSPSALEQAVDAFRAERGVAVGLGVSLTTPAGEEPPAIHLALVTPDGRRSKSLRFGGHPRLAARRAVAAALDLARRPDKVR